jgi:hypothetical protein
MGDLAPSDHCSILIVISLANKASLKNDLNIASMPLTTRTLD